jgi:hypothetical protein
MTAVQIKEEIQKALNDMPETALADVLNFVKQFQTHPFDQSSLDNNLKKIMSEDKGLLERLAK